MSVCAGCGYRERTAVPKFCPCGADLDRRRRSGGDYMWALIGMQPYRCRRCGKRRHRW